MTPENLLDEALDVFGGAQLQQVGNVGLFQAGHQRVIAKAGISAHTIRALMGRQSINECQQSRQRRVRMAVIARFDIDPEHEPKASH
ncbi:MAG: hypothetical protein U0236_09225 [Nitrospira sp.]